MLPSLDFHPDPLPAAGFPVEGGAQLISRPLDPVPTRAAAFLRGLASPRGGWFSAPLARLDAEDGIDASGKGWLCRRVSPIRAVNSGGPDGRGAGFLLFSDRSLLVFRRADRQGWDQTPPDDIQVRFLPVVLDLVRAIHPTPGAPPLVPVLLETEPGGVPGYGNAPLPDFVKTQIEREVEAWAGWISRIGPLPETPAAADPRWPCFLDGAGPGPDLLEQLGIHARRAGQALMAWHPGLMTRLNIQIAAARRLQGGIVPCQVIATADQIPARGKLYLPDMINDYLFEAIFTPDWPMDRLCAHRFLTLPGGHLRPNPMLLVDLDIRDSLSTHDRIALRRAFAPPPDPVPLPSHRKVA